MDRDTLILFGFALALTIFGWIDYVETSKAKVAPRKIKAEYDDGYSYFKIQVGVVDFFGWKACLLMAILLAMGGVYNEVHERHKTDASKRWEEAEARNKERSRQYLERFNNSGFVSKEQEAYMEELAKEEKPAYATTGLRDDPKKN